MSWDDFSYFLAVARLGGLSAAAHNLGTSASTVSRHIDALEERLGVVLFLRQPRGYVLTDAGLELQGRAQDVERAIMAIERVGAAQKVVGNIKIAAPESVAHYLIIPHLPKLLEQYPQLHVEVLVTRYRADLARREADIAIRITEPWQRDFAPDAIAKLIGKFNFGLYCEQHLLNSNKYWESLPYISWDSTWTKLPMVDWLQKLFPNHPPVLRSNSMQAHYLAARAGVGAAMLPTFLVKKERALVEIPVDMSHTLHELWMLHHEDLKTSKTLQAVKKFLIELFDSDLPIVKP